LPAVVADEGVEFERLVAAGHGTIDLLPSLEVPMYPPIHPPFQNAVDSLSVGISFVKNPSPVPPTCI
jgi:hypothetical protein